jgi:CheY-like chemotaxis protein
MENRIHRILFVDDDALILRGFRRSVDEYSDDWEVDFALSGQEALTKLAQRPFDAVVTICTCRAWTACSCWRWSTGSCRG